MTGTNYKPDHEVPIPNGSTRKVTFSEALSIHNTRPKPKRIPTMTFSKAMEFFRNDPEDPEWEQVRKITFVESLHIKNGILIFLAQHLLAMAGTLTVLYCLRVVCDSMGYMAVVGHMIGGIETLILLFAGVCLTKGM